MDKKARTPIVEYDDHFAIELPGDRPPQERDHLDDQAIVIAEDDSAIHFSRGRTKAIDEDAIRSTPRAEPEPESTLLLGWNPRGPRRGGTVGGVLAIE